MNETEHETIGWREFLRDVNLPDFLHMIDGEVRQLGTNLRVALQAFPRLPWGPLLTVAGLLMVLVRLILLFVVIVVFGAGILLITAARWIVGLFRR
jgi:hypothetical protein